MASSGAFAEVTVRDGVARSVVRPAHAAALCAGHFPGDPLLPGSALLGLMAELATVAQQNLPLIVIVLICGLQICGKWIGIRIFWLMWL